MLTTSEQSFEEKCSFFILVNIRFVYFIVYECNQLASSIVKSFYGEISVISLFHCSSVSGSETF